MKAISNAIGVMTRRRRARTPTEARMLVEVSSGLRLRASCWSTRNLFSGVQDYDARWPMGYEVASLIHKQILSRMWESGGSTEEMNRRW
jgi:hypothetical protein